MGFGRSVSSSTLGRSPHRRDGPEHRCGAHRCGRPLPATTTRHEPVRASHDRKSVPPNSPRPRPPLLPRCRRGRPLRSSFQWISLPLKPLLLADSIPTLARASLGKRSQVAPPVGDTVRGSQGLDSPALSPQLPGPLSLQGDVSGSWRAPPKLLHAHSTAR